MEEKEVYQHSIYRVVHGSRAYGTHRPDSDRDEKGVCVPPDPRYYLGFKRFEQKDKGWSDGVDRCIFDLRKFVSLALQCNPNIIEILYVDPSDILQIDALGQELRDVRDIFLSKQATNRFVGYAMSQLHRIEGHFRWLQSPPDKPLDKDFHHEHWLKEDEKFEREFDNHQFRVVPGSGGAFIEHFDKGAFKTANKKYGDYIKWQRDRNPARAELEAKYGYDAKHAMHLVRLLRMGKEILTEGKVLVKRPDAQELNDIRNGKFSYPELIGYAEQLKNEVYAAEETSPLPSKPDYEKAQEIVMQIVKAKLNWL